MFNIEKYFEDRSIDFHLEGEKNVTKGWVNIQCPFPGCSDPSWHLGINLDSLLINCYVCGIKGSVERVIQEIERCSFNQTQKIIKEYSSEEEIRIRKPLFRSEKEVEQCILSDIGKTFHRKHYEYLKSRSFNADYIIKKYNLMSVYNIGRYKFRIIIPYYYHSKLICFNTRDITDKASLRYQFCDIENSVIEVKHTFYNIDSVTNACIIVEGPSDVWRIGDGCIAVSGKHFTQEQLLMLREKEIKKALVLYDADDIEERIGEKLANNLTGIIPWVEQVELDSGDPGDLSLDEVNKIRNIIF